MAHLLPHVGLGLAAVGAAYPITRWYDKTYGIDSRKRKDRGFEVSFPVSKRIKGIPMAFSSRRRRPMRRRPYRRKRFRRRRVPFKRRRFTKAVRRVILRTAEPKVARIPENENLTLQQGDATTRVVYVSNPPGGMIQGTEADQFVGDKFFLKGVSLRGQVGTSGENTTFQGGTIRITLCWSKEQGSALDGPWTVFDSTTTSVANPTQVPPFVNPRFFEDSNASFVFVGNGMVLPFDTRGKVRTLGTKYITLNPGVENQAEGGVVGAPTLFDFYWPINKWMSIEDPDQGDISSPYRFKYGTYYLVMQVIANTNDVSATPVAEMEYTISCYFKDP